MQRLHNLLNKSTVQILRQIKPIVLFLLGVLPFSPLNRCLYFLALIYGGNLIFFNDQLTALFTNLIIILYTSLLLIFQSFLELFREYTLHSIGLP